jgi:transposase
MSDASNPLRLEVVGVFRNGRRRYDPASKQRLVEACLQPDVSLAGLALQHGVNANLLRKWVAEQQRQRRNGVAEGAIARASDAFVPVVESCGVTGAPEPPSPPPTQQLVQPPKGARRMDPPGPRLPGPRLPGLRLPGLRLVVEMPNGVTLRLECSGQDVELVSAMILTLGRCDVPAGR